ncbi:MAG: hypothetical protein ACRC0G_09670 [Fusobacteriaceae bacterium]
MKLVIKIVDVKKGANVEREAMMNDLIKVINILSVGLEQTAANEQERIVVIELTEKPSDYIMDLLEGYLVSKGFEFEISFN